MNSQLTRTSVNGIVAAMSSPLGQPAQQEQLVVGGGNSSHSSQTTQTTSTTYGARIFSNLGYAVRPAPFIYGAGLYGYPNRYNLPPAPYLPHLSNEQQIETRASNQQAIQAPSQPAPEQPPSQQCPSPAPPVAPLPQGTFLTSTYDREMAARQSAINTMSSQDRRTQEFWAQQMISRSKRCLAAFDWIRKEKGYRCSGGNHCITDALLEEGDGGFYVTDYKHEQSPYMGGANHWEGPYYKDMRSVRGPRNRGAFPRPVGTGPRSLEYTPHPELRDYDKRTPKNSGIPHGNDIPGDVLGIGRLESDEVDTRSWAGRQTLAYGVGEMGEQAGRRGRR